MTVKVIVAVITVVIKSAILGVIHYDKTGMIIRNGRQHKSCHPCNVLVILHFDLKLGNRQWSRDISKANDKHLRGKSAVNSL